MEPETILKAWDEVQRRAATDAPYRQRLRENPSAVLREHGMPWPEGVKLRTVENTPKHCHLVLPAQGHGPIADADLEAAAGGADIPAAAGWWVMALGTMGLASLSFATGNFLGGSAALQAYDKSTENFLKHLG